MQPPHAPQLPQLQLLLQLRARVSSPTGQCPQLRLSLSVLPGAHPLCPVQAPQAPQAPRPLQEAVLAATIADWRPRGAGTEPITGAVDTAAWDKTVTFMTSLGLVPKPVTSSDLLDTTFAPGS